MVISLVHKFCLMTSRSSPRALSYSTGIKPSLEICQFLDSQCVYVIYSFHVLDLSIIRWLNAFSRDCTTDKRPRRPTKHQHRELTPDSYPTNPRCGCLLGHIPCPGGGQFPTGSTNRKTPETTGNGTTVSTAYPSTDSAATKGV